MLDIYIWRNNARIRQLRISPLLRIW